MMPRVQLRTRAWFGVVAMLCVLAAPVSASSESFLEDDLELLQGGDGWTWLRIHDPEHPFKTVHAADVLVIRMSRLDEVPLSEAFKEEFRKAYRQRGRDYRLSDELLFTSREAIAHANDPRSWICGNSWSNKSYDLKKQFSKKWGEDWSDKFEDGALSGEVQVEPPTITGSFDGVVEFRVRRRCGVPLGVVFERLSLHPRLKASTSASLSLKATKKLKKKKEWSIYKLNAGSSTFWIGPIPVHLRYSVPIRVGLSLEAEGTLSYALESSLEAVAGLQFECSSSSCQTSPEFSLDFNPPRPHISLEGKAVGRMWLRPGIRVGLFHDALAYAEASGRVFLQGNLWGYTGDQCGDADGDGENEFVSGFAADLLFGVEVDLTLSGLGKDANWTLWDWSRSLAFFKTEFFRAASPFEPMIEAENLAAADNRLRVGDVGRWKLAMRPCYPFKDDSVTFRVEPSADGTEFDVSPKSGTIRSLTFDRPGDFDFTFTAVEDAQGRQLDTSTNLKIEVIPRRGEHRGKTISSDVEKPRGQTIQDG